MCCSALMAMSPCDRDRLFYLMSGTYILRRLTRRNRWPPTPRRNGLYTMTPTSIRHDDFVDSIAAALQYISIFHPADYIAHLARAYELEQGPAAKDAIAQILTNSKMCAEGRRPICQDTGIVNA